MLPIVYYKRVLSRSSRAQHRRSSLATAKAEPQPWIFGPDLSNQTRLDDDSGGRGRCGVQQELRCSSMYCKDVVTGRVAHRQTRCWGFGVISQAFWGERFITFFVCSLYTSLNKEISVSMNLWPKRTVLLEYVKSGTFSIFHARVLHWAASKSRLGVD